MALFIEVQIDAAAARDPEVVKKLVECCPVDIFSQGQDGAVEISEPDLDECTLCELCLNAAPGKVQVRKLYDAGAVLQRS